MSNRVMDAKAIFIEALDLSSRDELMRYLDDACGNDGELRGRVEQLLQAHEVAGNFLGGAPAEEALIEQPVADRTGMVIGPYKLIEPIGEGGFGVVYMAEQQHPIRRKVAVKILKPGMDTAKVIARFEAERQALALMEHANIARVLDAGETPLGRPYFVMELVKGVPITTYCDEHQLTPRERLALFIPVCQAIQHAHLKGIIHRDLKPTNVMIAAYDGKPVPKVIDFGVAKALGQPLTERTLATGFGSVVGTLEYMSPEQAEFNALDIDTRSDIYSLGVLLYELLAGTTPITKDRMSKAAVTEALRLIREEEPPRPSTRLSDSKDSLSAISAQRKLEPARLTKELRGDLDWVVMKCLEKDRNRRYESANGLVRDIERYLSGEPVEAGAPTLGYRMRKSVRRHKAILSAVSLVLLTLVGGIIGTTTGMVRTERQRSRAVTAESEAIVQRDKATEAAAAERLANESAQKRLAQIEKGNEILRSIFKDLDPNVEVSEGIPLRILIRERLDEAVNQLEGEAIGDALTVARLQQTLAASLLGLGDAQKAMTLFTKARAAFIECVGPQHQYTLRSMMGLANCYEALGQQDDALQLREETLGIQKATLGTSDNDTLATMHNLANSYAAVGRDTEALKLREETLAIRKPKLGIHHRDTLTTMTGLANSYATLGRQDEALKLREETLALSKAQLGRDHPLTLRCMNNLAISYAAFGRKDEAVQLFEETLGLRKAKLGSDHPDTLASMRSLAASYASIDRQADALRLREEAESIQRAKGELDNVSTLKAMYNLANSYASSGRAEEALKLREDTLTRQTITLGRDHPDTLLTMQSLAVSYSEAGRSDLAIPLVEEGLRRSEAMLGPDDPTTVNAIINLAWCLKKSGKLERAFELYQRAATAMEPRGFQDQSAMRLVADLLGCQEQLKQHDQWDFWLRKWLAIMKAKLGAESPGYAKTLAFISRNLLEQHRWGDAESLLRDSLPISQSKEPDNWGTFYAEFMLGVALAGQDRFADAEPLLLHGYNGLNARKSRIPKSAQSNLIWALEHLVEFYDAWGKPDEAATWRAKLELDKSGLDN